MLLADAADLSRWAAAQADADLVLAVDRQVLVDAQAAARAERQIAQVVVLRQVLGRLVGRRDRPGPPVLPIASRLTLRAVVM